MKNPISIEELMALLSNEATKAQTIQNYFYYVQTSPFEGEYKLKETIMLTSISVDLEEDEGFIGSGLILEAMDKANNDSREKEIKSMKK
ncbi:MAG: hypothetical protein IPO92_10385 [Saprospiraceae bacterium]|nr:hypothetical protein [Saprospiraceae bacterium]